MSAPLPRDETQNRVRRRTADLMAANAALEAEIAERKRAEEALKRSQMQLADAQQLARLGSWDWHLPSNTHTWSHELYRIFGLEPGACPVGLDAFMKVVHPEDTARVKQVLAVALKRGQPFQYYHRIIRPDGAIRLIFARGAASADEAGQPVRLFGTAQDITERRRAEDELARSHEQLRALAARLESVREEERTHLSREIHDELGQVLTGLKMDLAWLDRRLPEAGDSAVTDGDAAPLHAKIASMSQQLDATIHAVRKIATDLRPGVLDSFGLKAAIEWQTQEFQKRAGIRCACVCQIEDETLDPQRSTAVFRILQEALTNVARHAGATRVNVTLKERAGHLILVVRDNGRGIVMHDRVQTQSLGLVGMQERALLLGGDLKIKGGKGTTVTVRLPLQR